MYCTAPAGGRHGSAPAASADLDNDVNPAVVAARVVAGVVLEVQGLAKVGVASGWGEGASELDRWGSPGVWEGRWDGMDAGERGLFLLCWCLGWRRGRGRRRTGVEVLAGSGALFG